ncbi:LysR family transcriptional regulator [Magnetovibrio sp.]|uniref:LysR family transcriptional regulator n=1 Tax=Magnetovibrio sp. TaxID=2024836 RepID=UPI002F91CC1D
MHYPVNVDQTIRYNRSMVNLTQLQTFIEIARTGSFTQASQRLSVPRSTVSARMQALEERLNVRLLHRTTRRVALTSEGRSYLDTCQAALDRLMAAESELAQTNRLSGTIRMTVPIDMSKTYLAHTLNAFLAENPSLNIEVVVSDETLDLVANHIDLALRGGAPGGEGLVARRFGEGRMALYASPAYKTANISQAPLQSLTGHILFDPAQQRRRTKALNGAQKGPIETRNFELAKALAIQSAGIALLPQSLCRQEVAAGLLVPLEFDKVLTDLALYIVLPTRQYVPARVRALIDFLVSTDKISDQLT